jgi:excisionase family DNA binding protein
MKHVGPTTTSVEVSPPTILTVQELSEHLRVHPRTIYRLLRDKQIPGFRVGGDWRFDMDMIDRWRSEGEQTAVTARYHKRLS